MLGVCVCLGCVIVCAVCYCLFAFAWVCGVTLLWSLCVIWICFWMFWVVLVGFLVCWLVCCLTCCWLVFVVILLRCFFVVCWIASVWFSFPGFCDLVCFWAEFWLFVLLGFVGFLWIFTLCWVCSAGVCGCGQFVPFC